MSSLQGELPDIFPAPVKSVKHVQDLTCSVSRFSWPFEANHSLEISRHYRHARQENLQLYNGTVLLARRWSIRPEGFSAQFFPTDFASYLYWRKHSTQDQQVVNCAPAAAVISDDERVLIASTFSLDKRNTKFCLPGGMPEPGDAEGSRLDLDYALFRELGEEIGLSKCHVEQLPGWYIVAGASWIIAVKCMKCSMDSHVLSTRIRKHMTRQRIPELIGIHFRSLSTGWRNLLGLS